MTTGIRELCEARGVGRPDLMKRFEVSEDTVRRWEGGGGMSVARLQELADYLEASTDDVLGRDRDGTAA